MSIREAVEAAVDVRAPIELFRDALSRESLLGVPISCSAQFVAVAEIDQDLRFDGVSIVSLADITRIWWNAPHLAIAHEIAEVSAPTHLARLVELYAGISLDSKQSALDALKRVENCVTLYTEAVDASVCFVGELHERSRDMITLCAYGSTRAVGRSLLTIPLSDVTRVDVGGRYELALRRYYEGRK